MSAVKDHEKTDWRALHVVVVSAEPSHRDIIISGLEAAGVGNISQTESVSALTFLEDRDNADIVLVDITEFNASALAEGLPLASSLSAPIAMFVDSSLEIDLERLIDAGVNSIIVDGLGAQRIPYVVETTLYRHRRMRGLEIQLKEAQTKLEERKLLDRAKGLLMEKREIPEAEAYALIRKAAMSRNCTVTEIAQSVIIAAEI